MQKYWTEEEENMAIELFEQKLEYEDIAKKLNRTKVSVKSKLNKLGFTKTKNRVGKPHSEESIKKKKKSLRKIYSIDEQFFINYKKDSVK